MSRIDDVTKDYLRSTNASIAFDERRYEAAEPGLRRLLGAWKPSREARAIDLACGSGELLYALRRAGVRALRGVDADATSVELATKFGGAQVEQGDVVAYLRSQPDASADFVSAMNLLEHLDKDGVYDVFAEVRRVLAPGGHFVAMTPNGMSPFAGTTRYWDFTHQLAFTPSAVRQVARVTGWGEAAEFRECGPVPHGVLSSARWAAWKVLHAGVAAWFLIENGTTRGGVYTSDMLFRLTKRSA